MPIIGKRVKIFKKGTNNESYVAIDETDNEEQPDKDRGDADSEESGLQLVVDIREDSERDTDGGKYGTSGTSAHTEGCADLEGVSVVV